LVIGGETDEEDPTSQFAVRRDLCDVDSCCGQYTCSSGRNNKESEARQALKIIKHYKMNSQCFVGRPGPSLEYYLVNGKAPVGAMPGEDAVPFDPNNAQVTNIGGRWKIVDGTHWILDFAEKKVEADTALKIIKKYKFSYICFVGRPGASMTYFRVDPSTLHLAMPGLVGKLFVPPTEDCIKFDPDNVRAKKFGDRWTLVDGTMSLLDFGDSRSECFQARRIIKEYGLNSQCFVGAVLFRAKTVSGSIQPTLR